MSVFLGIRVLMVIYELCSPDFSHGVSFLILEDNEMDALDRKSNETFTLLRSILERGYDVLYMEPNSLIKRNPYEFIKRDVDATLMLDETLLYSWTRGILKNRDINLVSILCFVVAASKKYYLPSASTGLIHIKSNTEGIILACELQILQTRYKINSFDEILNKLIFDPSFFTLIMNMVEEGKRIPQSVVTATRRKVRFLPQLVFQNGVIAKTTRDIRGVEEVHWDRRQVDSAVIYVIIKKEVRTNILSF